MYVNGFGGNTKVGDVCGTCKSLLSELDACVLGGSAVMYVGLNEVRFLGTDVVGAVYIGATVPSSEVVCTQAVDCETGVLVVWVLTFDTGSTESVPNDAKFSAALQSSASRELRPSMTSWSCADFSIHFSTSSKVFSLYNSSSSSNSASRSSFSAAANSSCRSASSSASCRCRCASSSASRCCRCIIGSAEALPILCASDFCERERERERRL